MKRTRRATALLLTLAVATGSYADWNASEYMSGLTNAAGRGSSPPSPVDAKGAAVFAVPIAVPPGTGGMQPRLALTYSSHAHGESWVGYGWSLDLGRICRSTKEGVPDWATDPNLPERFELDGRELVPSPTTPGRYHTKRESFLRIDAVPGAGWTVRLTAIEARRWVDRCSIPAR